MNKIRTGRRRDRAGVAFIVVMGIIAILLIAGINMTHVTGNSAHISRVLNESEQALCTAEAGVADMIMKMSTNYHGWMSGTNNGTYAGGTFAVSTRTDTNTANVTITSRGTYRSQKRTVALELMGTLWDLYDQTIGVDGCIVCGGNATLETAALTINGTVHANQNIYHSTGNTVINGDVSACGVVEVDVAAGMTATSNAAPVVVPNYLPFDAWKALAQSNGIYYATNTLITGEDLRPSNGVVYVQGNVEVVNRSSIVGTLVASGRITINNRFDSTPFNTNWPCLMAGTDLEEYNLNSYHGVMFAGNNIILRNRRNIVGALIALNNVLIENASTIDPLQHYPAWSPNDTNTSPPSVIMGGWLQ